MLTSKRNWIRPLISFIVIALIAIAFYFLFRNVKFSDLAGDFANFHYFWLLPALAVYLLGYIIRGYRWVILLAPIKKCSFYSLFPTLLIGFMANNVLPARAGEFIRAHLNGKKEGLSRSTSLGTIILERLFDGMAMLVILGLAISLRHPSSTDFTQNIEGTAAKASYIFGAAFLLFFSMLLFKKKTIRIINYVISHAPRKHHQKLEKIAHTFLDGLKILQNARESFLVLTTSLAAWTCEFSAFYLIAMGFHLAPEPLHFNSAALLMAIVNLGLMVPSTPGGLGIFEGIGVTLLSVYNVPNHTALAYIVTVHLLVFLPITLWGYYFLQHEGLTLKAIEQEKKTR
jgi:glycosyltransferase 2 family protein